ncbi:hypothetical protein [Mucilaginibacter ginsenosidivorax]|uniref:DUF4412 domain-containing protein n=1 Tax=Mucilaginibacter ginsenosidivorax TaxID=862126 RepID=A0A5B8VVD6_9SPHI|nr:hypothetical protein [Mucilaginibacter ginsenosidivorax]QEC75369.1 hypothetical protein FSB76_05205 [Mucilaginibacter ginsenosidivorax]
MQTRTLILLLLLCSGKLFAQTTEKFTPALMETKSGAKVVYTSDRHSITFDVVSKKIVPTDNPNLINVDNKPLQFILIPNSALSTTDTTLARQKAELLGYADYELDYVKKEVKMKISGVTEKWITINNKLFLFWTYNMPPDNKSVLQQLNLSTLCFAHVLNLNNPVTQGETLETNSDLLLNAAKTLRLNNFKVDLEALYKQLQDEMKQ